MPGEIARANKAVFTKDDGAVRLNTGCAVFLYGEYPLSRKSNLSTYAYSQLYFVR